MRDIFVTYDFEETNPEVYSEFLSQAGKQGWRQWKWGRSNKKWLRLPNSTLIGEFNSTTTAMTAFDKAVAATSAETEAPLTVRKYFLAAYLGEMYSSDELTTKHNLDAV